MCGWVSGWVGEHEAMERSQMAVAVVQVEART